MGWVSPTGDNDPDSKWDAETSAYDDNEATAAYNQEQENYYLELTHEALNCDKIRIMACDFHVDTYYDAAVIIGVYYSDDWHTIFTGTVTDRTWVEKPIGSTQSVTAVRVTMTDTYYDFHNLFEVDFWEVEAPPPVYIPKVIMVT